MDIQNFFATQLAQSGGSTSSGLASDSASNLNGLSFIDLIMSQMKDAQSASETAQNNTPLPSQDENDALDPDNSLFGKGSKIDIVALLADNPEVAEQVKKFADGSADELTETLALNQRVFDELLKPVDGKISLGSDFIELNIDELQKTTEEDASEIADLLFISDTQSNADFLNKLKVISEKIESLSEEGSTQLVATNLTPEQITELQDYISKVTNGEEEIDLPECLENCALFVGAVQITQPQDTPEITISGQSIVISPRTPRSQDKLPTPPSEGEVGNDGLETTKNLNSATKATLENQASLLNQKNSAGIDQTQLTSTDNPNDTEKDFRTFLKNFAENGEQAQRTTRSNAEHSAQQNSPGENQTSSLTPQTKSTPHTLQGWSFGMDSGTMTYSEWADTVGDDFTLSGSGNTTSTTSLQNLTSLVTQSPAAGSAHPATQMVAATLVKNAGQGKDTNITMQLDPPELGKIEVQMSFGKDKEFKTKMIIEKPETHAMLQRDSQLLERTLQNAGLDLSENALSFELAQDGHEFSHNGSHDGSGGGYSGGSNSAGDNSETIQSTMTWSVDPETGHLHYSILA